MKLCIHSAAIKCIQKRSCTGCAMDPNTPIKEWPKAPTPIKQAPPVRVPKPKLARPIVKLEVKPLTHPTNLGYRIHTLEEFSVALEMGCNVETINGRLYAK